jgi:hypothetical protein
MTHTFKLERLDGTPADPPSFKTTVLAWSPAIAARDGPRQAGLVRSAVRAYHLELCLSRALGTRSGNTAR